MTSSTRYPCTFEMPQGVLTRLRRTGRPLGGKPPGRGKYAVTTHHSNDAPAPGGHELWSLREDVQVELAPGDGPVLLRSRWGAVRVQRRSRVVREAIHRMRLGPISLENVIAGPARRVGTTGGPRGGAWGGAWGGDGGGDGAEADRGSGYHPQWTHLYQVLASLQPLIVRSLGMDNRQPLLSVVPLAPRSRFRPVLPPPDAPARLSAFAELRTDGTQF